MCYELGSLPGATGIFTICPARGIDFFGQRTKLTKLLRKELNKLNVPTLIFWGRQDRIIPVSHAPIAAASIPNAKLTVFDKCGHMPMFEYPEGFNKLTLDFLAK